MIYLEGIESLIESIYLEDNISDQPGGCNVFVNPGNIKYLTGKTIILNIKNYPEEKISQLTKNGCKIISRVYRDLPNIEVQPYILRINFGIVWNGKIVEDFRNFSDLLLKKTYEYQDGVLYFPKVFTGNNKSVDEYGNLNCLGWALQQVGVNIKTDTPFMNLDIVKTGKFIL